MQKKTYKELLEENKKLKKKNEILNAAINEAAHIFASNPPGDLNEYTEEMFQALMGCKEHPYQWKYYLLKKGIEKTGITKL